MPTSEEFCENTQSTENAVLSSVMTPENLVISLLCFSALCLYMRRMRNRGIVSMPAPAATVLAPAPTWAQSLLSQLSDIASRKSTGVSLHAIEQRLTGTILQEQHLQDLNQEHECNSERITLLDFAVKNDFWRIAMALVSRGVKLTPSFISRCNSYAQPSLYLSEHMAQRSQEMASYPANEYGAFGMAVNYFLRHGLLNGNEWASRERIYRSVASQILKMSDQIHSIKKARALLIGGGSDIVNKMVTEPRRTASVQVLAANIIVHLSLVANGEKFETRLSRIQGELFTNYTAYSAPVQALEAVATTRPVI